MSIINIGSSSYSVQDDWFNVAMKYFAIDPENENGINALKAGLFGYNNEIQSNEIKNNVYHRNVLYDEHFLNTASFPESIANFAKLYNVDMELATPAKLRATLAIKRDDIIDSPLLEQIASTDSTLEGFSRRVYKLTLSKDYVFSIQQIPFRLPYDLQFIVRENELSGTFSITVKYDIEDTDFPFLKVTTDPYLKSWNETTNSGDYLFIGIDLYQLYKQTKTFSITSNNYLDNLFLTTSFSNQIAYIEVYYIYNGIRKTVECYQNNQYADKFNDSYCFYSIKNNNLELSFGADSNAFRPRKNSEIELIMYTTLGSGGNFTYTGNIDVNFGSTNEFINLSINVQPITDSAGGKDKYTTTELKNKIIEAAISRNNIITDTDLNYYFSTFNTNSSVNGSNIEFFKKRNDILKRVFTGYLTMRETGGKVIPTNTAPHLSISKTFLEENKDGILRDNSKVLYDRVNDIFTLFENDTINSSKDGKFIIDRTLEGFDFVYDAFNNIISYSYKNGDDVYVKSFRYKIETATTKYIESEIITKENEPINQWQRVIEPTIEVECIGGNYIIFAMEDVLHVSVKSLDYQDEENIVIKPIYTISENKNKPPVINKNSFKIKSDDYLADKRFILYSIPYVIKLINSPIYKCNYYVTSVYEIYELQLLNVNNFINKNFAFNNIQIEKKPNIDQDINTTDSYVITADLNTNLSAEELDDLCEVRMIIYDSDKEAKGYLKLERIPESFSYMGLLQTNNDIINKDGKIKIIGSLYDINNGTHITYSELTEKINIELSVLYKDGEDIYKYGNFDYMNYLEENEDGKNLRDYATTTVYGNVKEISLFKNLEDYMYSDVIPKKTIDNNGVEISTYYDVKQVPLVEYSYYQQKYDEVLDILDAYDDVSYELINTLENNNSLDIKFTNTYGSSRYWVTDTNRLEFARENFDYVDVTSIPLNFTIYTNNTISTSTDAMIKEYISDFVEASNGTGLFAISNLIRSLENTFSEIQYVEFGKIAGEDTQKIFNAFEGFHNMTSEEINDYVPEYLNIEKILKYDDTVNDGIDLYLKYDYNINVTYK